MAIGYSITLLSEWNFGDHGEVRPTHHEVLEGETVEDLIRRVIPAKPYAPADARSQIVLQVTVEGAERRRVEAQTDSGAGLF